MKSVENPISPAPLPPPPPTSPTTPTSHYHHDNVGGKKEHRQIWRRFETLICVSISDFLKILYWPATIIDLLNDEYHAVIQY